MAADGLPDQNRVPDHPAASEAAREAGDSAQVQVHDQRELEALALQRHAKGQV